MSDFAGARLVMRSARSATEDELRDLPLTRDCTGLTIGSLPFCPAP